MACWTERGVQYSDWLNMGSRGWGAFRLKVTCDFLTLDIRGAAGEEWRAGCRSEAAFYLSVLDGLYLYQGGRAMSIGRREGRRCIIITFSFSYD